MQQDAYNFIQVQQSTTYIKLDVRIITNMCMCVMHVCGGLCTDIVYRHSFGMHSDRAHPKFLKDSGSVCPHCPEKPMLSLLAITNPR